MPAKTRRTFDAEEPGPNEPLEPMQPRFKYENRSKVTPAICWTLINDVLIGDPMPLDRSDNIEAGWRCVQWRPLCR